MIFSSLLLFVAVCVAQRTAVVGDSYAVGMKSTLSQVCEDCKFFVLRGQTYNRSLTRGSSWAATSLNTKRLSASELRRA